MAGGVIRDDTRIKAAIPTLRDLMHRGATTVVMSHLGRPNGPDPAFSLRPVGRGAVRIGLRGPDGAVGRRPPPGGEGAPPREREVPSRGREQRPGVRSPA